MDQTKCISDKQWELYARGSLLPQEQSLLLAHASTCPICTDIKEGIDAMQEPATLADKVLAINKEIDKRLEPKQARRIPLVYWFSAAAMVVLAGFLFLWLDQKVNQQLSVTLAEPHDSIEAPGDLALQTAPEHNLAAKQKQIKRKVVQKIQSVRGAQPEEITIFKAPTKTEQPLSIASASDEEKSSGKESVASNTEQDVQLNKIPEQIEKPTSDQVMVSETKIASKKLSKTNPYPGNYANTQNNQMENVGNYKTLKDIQSDSLALTKAQMLFDSMQFESSSRTLEPLVQLNEGKYYADALWLLAQNQLALGQKKEAKKVLKQLIALKGKYATEAQKKLDEL